MYTSHINYLRRANVMSMLRQLNMMSSNEIARRMAMRMSFGKVLSQILVSVCAIPPKDKMTCDVDGLLAVEGVHVFVFFFFALVRFSEGGYQAPL